LGASKAASLPPESLVAVDVPDWLLISPMQGEVIVQGKLTVAPEIEFGIVTNIFRVEARRVDRVPPTVRTPHKPPVAGETRELAVKELGNFDYDPDQGGVIPDDVKALSGTKVRLKGYMLPLSQARKVTRFALVPSVFSCCFGQPPGVQHTVIVDCEPGKSVAYSSDPVAVEGTLTVGEVKEDKYTIALFQLVCTNVAPSK
jgi:hypothetical protein